MNIPIFELFFVIMILVNFIGYFIIRRKIVAYIGDLNSYEKVVGEIAEQITKDVKGGKFTYNRYKIEYLNKTILVDSSFGSNPPSGTIGDRRNLLYNGVSILPDNYLVNNHMFLLNVFFFIQIPILVVIYFIISRIPL